MGMQAMRRAWDSAWHVRDTGSPCVHGGGEAACLRQRECPSWVSAEVAHTANRLGRSGGLFPSCWLTAGKSFLHFVKLQNQRPDSPFVLPAESCLWCDLHCIHLCLFTFSSKTLIVFVLSPLWPAVCLLFLSDSHPHSLQVSRPQS